MKKLAKQSSKTKISLVKKFVILGVVVLSLGYIVSRAQKSAEIMVLSGGMGASTTTVSKTLVPAKTVVSGKTVVDTTKTGTVGTGTTVGTTVTKPANTALGKSKDSEPEPVRTVAVTDKAGVLNGKLVTSPTLLTQIKETVVSVGENIFGNAPSDKDAGIKLDTAPSLSSFGTSPGREITSGKSPAGVDTSKMVDQSNTSFDCAGGECTLKQDQAAGAERTITNGSLGGKNATSTTPVTVKAGAVVGKSCPGSSSSIASGAWAQTGDVYEEERPASRACVKCDNGNWKTGKENIVNCDTVAYLAPPHLVSQVDNSTTTGPKIGCWKANTWYADTQSIDDQVCSQGHWCPNGQAWNGKACVSGKTIVTNTIPVNASCSESVEIERINSNCAEGMMRVTATHPNCLIDTSCVPNNQYQLSGASNNIGDAVVGVVPNSDSTAPFGPGEFYEKHKYRAVVSTIVGAVPGCIAGGVIGAVATPLGIGAIPGCLIGGAGGGGVTNMAGNIISNAEDASLSPDSTAPFGPGEFYEKHKYRAVVSTIVGAVPGCIAGGVIGAVATPLGIGAIPGCLIGGAGGGGVTNMAGNILSNSQDAALNK